MDSKYSLLLFRNEVKQRYASQPHVYHQLVQLLQRFNTNNIDMEQLKSSVELLLIESEDLINKFLAQLTMLLPPSERRSKMFSEKSRDFVLKVKDKFESKGQPDKYKLFIAILRNVGSSSLKDTCTQVEMLFYDEPQLLAEFEDMIKVEFLNSDGGSSNSSDNGSGVPAVVVLPPNSPFASASSPTAQKDVTKSTSPLITGNNCKKPTASEIPKPTAASAVLLGSRDGNGNQNDLPRIEPRVRSNTISNASPPEKRRSSPFKVLLPSRALNWICRDKSPTNPSREKRDKSPASRDKSPAPRNEDNTVNSEEQAGQPSSLTKKRSSSIAYSGGPFAWKKGKSPRDDSPNEPQSLDIYLSTAPAGSLSPHNGCGRHSGGSILGNTNNTGADKKSSRRKSASEAVESSRKKDSSKGSKIKKSEGETTTTTTDSPTKRKTKTFKEMLRIAAKKPINNTTLL